jgi:membrane fusion protein (multidrug efflux system)
VKLPLENGSRYDQPGTLQVSEVTVDPGTGAVTMRAVFPNDTGPLLPGMFVREELQEGIRQASIRAPQTGRDP